MKRPITSVFFLPLLMLASVACGPQSIPAPRGVLLISVDSLRADHVSSYGYRSFTQPGIQTTPIVDRMLAESGTLFERASSTTSWTLPSHMAMLTGRPNELHGVREIGYQLDQTQNPLAELFQTAGWRTGGFWSGPNLDPWFGFDRGFETYVDCSSSREEAVDKVFDFKNGMNEKQISAKHADLQRLHDASHIGMTGDKLVAAFEEWFESIGDDETFFAFVHMWDVHYDYTPPAEFNVFDPNYRGSVDGRNVDDRSSKRNPPSRRDLDHIIALYDGEIRLTDYNIGNILEQLRARGRLDDTLIIFTSDHGEEFLEHGNLGHGNTLFEEVIHVPLIMRYPAGVPAGRRDDSLVSLVDIAPTILDYCRIPLPSTIWGKSLRSVLNGEVEARLLPLERTYLSPDEGKIKVEEMRGVRAEGFKLIRDTESAGGKVFFYDLEQDAGEQTPLLSGQLGKGDPRVQNAFRLWQELDQAGPGSQEGFGDLPEDLESRLDEFGYMGEEDQGSGE